MLSAIFAGLVAVAAAAPTATVLGKRQSTCSALGSVETTINDVSYNLTGPFTLIMNAPSLKQNGFYAHAGYPSIYTTIIFDVGPARKAENATEFYLDPNMVLTTIYNGTVFYADDVSPVYDGNLDDSNVVISATPTNNVTCTIDSACGTTCQSAGASYNCLADPTFQPDWRIASEEKGAGGGCIPFTITADPGSASS